MNDTETPPPRAPAQPSAGARSPLSGLLPVLLAACAGTPPGAATAPVPPPRPYTAALPPPLAAVSAPDVARGGRLFDAWDDVLVTGFVPDRPGTPEADGRGGPFGDGTLLDAHRQPMLNTGHDFRLVKLFGSDLRGAEGAFASCGTDAPIVLVPNFLSNTEDASTWRARLAAGEDGIPAFGSMLDARDLVDVVAFMLAVRDGELPRPDALFRAVAGVPCRVERIPGGDPAAGKTLHNAHCTRCHGHDGRALALGPAHQSLGEFARGHIKDAWYVILSGKAGTAMPGLIDELPRAQLAPALTDLFATYADVDAFPPR